MSAEWEALLVEWMEEQKICGNKKPSVAAGYKSGFAEGGAQGMEEALRMAYEIHEEHNPGACR